MAILKKGLVQVYTGSGKGKTTAAWGIACRMAGAGGRVYICQFLKPASQKSGEMVCGQRCGDRITIERLHTAWPNKPLPFEGRLVGRMQKAIAKKLGEIRELAAEGKYDLMILDEIIVCMVWKLARREDIWSIIEARQKHVELILTGRGADKELTRKADLVTEMMEIKHPFQMGVKARKGIEY